jgi:dihydroorotate dehydrogenase
MSSFLYNTLIKPALFALDPETAHNTMRSVARAANAPIVSRALDKVYRVNDERLHVSVAGMEFSNPIGLAAGFDKNAELLGLWSGLGFGHIEVGTVTGRQQAGNPRPRIFRLPADHALINRMGFPSEGADLTAERLRQMRAVLKNLPPIGVNIGKTKDVDIDHAIDDYRYSFERLAPIADYVAVNVSSPNTPGLRQLQDRARLDELLSALCECNLHHRPIFLKVAPDLSFPALEEVVQCCIDNKIAGIIATNTTLGRDSLKTSIDQSGGLSGAPLTNKSLEVVRFLGSLTKGRLDLIGVGGVFTANDVLAMLAAGASMVQIYTALIYEGPSLVSNILQRLVKFINATGCKNVIEAAAAWESGCGSATNSQLSASNRH